jgi:hypothetical protein
MACFSISKAVFSTAVNRNESQNKLFAFKLASVRKHKTEHRGAGGYEEHSTSSESLKPSK